MITSWITFNWSGEYTCEPSRFAGTCRQYSKKAIAQLPKITFHKATPLNLRCPYHANVMKMFDPTSIATGQIRAPIHNPPENP